MSLNECMLLVFAVLFAAPVLSVNYALVFSRELRAVRFKFEPFNFPREGYESLGTEQ